MLQNIKANIEKLIEAYEASAAERAVLAQKLSASEQKNEDYKKQIIELEQKIDSLRLTEAMLGVSENKNEAKRRIDKLIREIDKCISLMED